MSGGKVVTRHILWRRGLIAKQHVNSVFFSRNNDHILPDESDISANNCVDNQTRKLKCCEHKIADSLCNKIEELKATVSSNSPDVITMTGFCPKKARGVNSTATTIQIPGYNIFNMK